MFGLIGNFGPWELILIVVILLIVIGPGKLPQVGQSIGKALQNFRKAK
ncbi:MAG: twin-arginine translocase TatA/TatE family subunit, partial [Syntrophomonadaceae bacterium]